jgi:hypothetical protein
LKLSMFSRGNGAFLALICAAMGTACSQEFPYQQLPPQFEYSQSQNGKVGQKTVVRKGDPAYGALVEFLKAPGYNWNQDFNTYAPSLSFESERMIINCRDDLVVVNIGRSRSDPMKQLVSHQPGCRTKVMEAITSNVQEHHL